MSLLLLVADTKSKLQKQQGKVKKLNKNIATKFLTLKKL